ncbi:MAG: hypothetical protein SFV81_07300 [Pirellulaceae bacterium]|nr:hypothetical protein [Pirellulaceae bacterium]
MSNRMQQSLICGVLFCGLAAANLVDGQEPKADANSVRLERRYALFVERAKEIKLATSSGEALLLNESPLMKYSRDGSKRLGSVFLWTSSNRRPAAIGTIGSIPANGEHLFTELHWLLDQPLQEIELSQTAPKIWSFDGKQPDSAVPMSPAPAAQEQFRLIQMRNIARQFKAKMTDGTQSHELRLLPQPLYRYQASTQEQDGAIFALVWTDGTDPELLLHIYTAGKEQPVWNWQPIRFTWRALELEHLEKQVWKSAEFTNRNDARQTGPYITTMTEKLVD